MVTEAEQEIGHSNRLTNMSSLLPNLKILFKKVWELTHFYCMISCCFPSAIPLIDNNVVQDNKTGCVKKSINNPFLLFLNNEVLTFMLIQDKTRINVD